MYSWIFGSAYSKAIMTLCPHLPDSELSVLYKIKAMIEGEFIIAINGPSRQVAQGCQCLDQFRANFFPRNGSLTRACADAATESRYTPYAQGVSFGLDNLSHRCTKSL